jgi:hypothetical protein
MDLSELDTLPPAPVNVRLWRSDAEQIPVECIYVGDDSLGNHVWKAMLATPGDGRLWSLRADELPAKTVIRFG